MMNIVLLLCFSIFISRAYSCDFKTEIISFSAPLTMVLEEMDLLSVKNLKAIGKDHPISKSYSGKRLKEENEELNQNLDFLKSKKLILSPNSYVDKILESHENLEFELLPTTKMTADQAFENIMKFLKDNTSGCDDKLKALNSKVKKIVDNVIPYPKTLNAVFFDGKIVEKKYPSMVISNDLFVRDFRTSKLVKTYPSSQERVLADHDVIEKLGNFYFFGIIDGNSENMKVEKVNNDGYYNLSMRGIFIPGIRQLYFLEQFAKYNF